MTGAGKRKGDAAERATRVALHRLGFPWTEKTRAGYERDHGDLHLVPGPAVIAQVKAWRTYEWGDWFRGLGEQIVNAKADYGFLVLRRPGMSDERGEEFIVAMRLGEFTKLLRQAGYGEPLESDGAA